SRLSYWGKDAAARKGSGAIRVTFRPGDNGRIGTSRVPRSRRAVAGGRTRPDEQPSRAAQLAASLVGSAQLGTARVRTEPRLARSYRARYRTEGLDAARAVVPARSTPEARSGPRPVIVALACAHGGPSVRDRSRAFHRLRRLELLCRR